jgi:hypothetical protein
LSALRSRLAGQASNRHMLREWCRDRGERCGNGAGHASGGDREGERKRIAADVCRRPGACDFPENHGGHVNSGVLRTRRHDGRRRAMVEPLLAGPVDRPAHIRFRAVPDWATHGPNSSGPAQLGVETEQLESLRSARLRLCLHRFGHRDVSFEAKRFRHRAVAIDQLSAGDVVAAGPG